MNGYSNVLRVHSQKEEQGEEIIFDHICPSSCPLVENGKVAHFLDSRGLLIGFEEKGLELRLKHREQAGRPTNQTEKALKALRKKS
jgi:hypothetical protein